MTMSSTSTTTTTSTSEMEAEIYLAAVRNELDDLSEEERADLLEDLALHLGELAAANRDDDSPPLQVRLGSPADYAAELRSAAGLPPRVVRPPGEGPDKRRLRELLGSSPAGRLATTAWRHPWAGEVRTILSELGPAWWVLRGYLVVALPALWSPDRFDDFPLPTILGSGVVGAAAVLAAVAVSVRVGRRRLSPRAQLALGGLDVLLVLGAVALLSHADTRLSAHHAHSYMSSPWAGYELNSPQGPVTNIYPYARDGSPLEDVLLFDQDGRPLRTPVQEWWPDGCRRTVAHAVAADGVAVEFSYPKRYVLVERPPMTACATAPARPPVPLPEFSPLAGA